MRGSPAAATAPNAAPSFRRPTAPLDPAIEATFVPAEGPRPARLALWTLTRSTDDDGAPSHVPHDLVDLARTSRGTIDVAVPEGRNVRRRTVPALLIDWPDALGPLATLPLDDDLSVSLATWVVVARFGVDLVARGRLVPSVTSDDVACWRIAELGLADARRHRQLVDALPPLAHALVAPAPAPTTGEPVGPLSLIAPEQVVDWALDACADALVRSPAASLLVASAAAPFAASPARTASGLRPWARNMDHELGRGAGAHPGIRIEPPDDPDPDDPDLDEPLLKAVLQLRSKSDPSLVIDAVDLWDAPGAVLARMGDDAETDLLLALRRGAPLWAPLERALNDRRPDRLFIDDDQAAELMGSAGEALTAAGFEVLWPTDLLAQPIELRAVVETPSPHTDGSAALDLASIVAFDWKASLGGVPLTAEEMTALAEAKRPLVRLRGRWVVADPAAIARLRRRGQVRVGDALAAALSGSLVVDGEATDVELDDGRLADLAAQLATVGADSPRELPEPLGLVATLRPYQRRGLAWLAVMTDLGVGGCLADDMGLGKTIQLIALHLHRHRPGHDGGGPTLVVCPTSLLGNWQREVERFAPGVPVRRFHGGTRHLDDLADNEIVLVTYGVVRKDADTLADAHWGLVVADEAQHAKNPLSRTARALRSIPAPARLALTGTPIENRLTELWSILDWTTPGLLGSLDRFQRKVAVPIERHQDREATERLAATVRPFVLRRRKIDPGIAPELPPKIERDVIVPMTPEQVTLYEATVREVMDQISHAEGFSRRGLVLRLLTGLKQITNHPAQYLRQTGPLSNRSGKLDALDELLDVIVSEGEAALVFTQYVQMGRLIESHLASRSIDNAFLHGSVPVSAREAMVDRFQAGDMPVLLLSLKAGGTGLNLTAATHVIHYDRWWNPAVEDQATDRAHRIGQTRSVEVHRLVTEGTIEDRIAALLAAKRGLAESVVGAGETWISEMSDDELADLVALRGPE